MEESNSPAVGCKKVNSKGQRVFPSRVREGASESRGTVRHQGEEEPVKRGEAGCFTKKGADL